MADPMTPERLAEIRERAESVRTWKAVWSAPVPQLCDVDIPDLLAEVKRLRHDLDVQRAAMATMLEDERQMQAAHDRTRAELDAARAEVERLRTLLRDMTDPDPCRFDHHGGCQAHGYLDLKPGEKCPHAEAKELLALGATEAGR